MANDPLGRSTAAVSGQERHPRWRVGLLGVVAFVAAFWFLRETVSLTLPLACALLLALAVWPLVRAIRNAAPRALQWVGPAVGVLVVLALVLAFLAGLGLAGRQIYQLLSDLRPELQQSFGQLGIDGAGGLASDIGAETGSLISNAMRALGFTAQALGGIVLILFLMLLMLTEAGNWHEKMLAMSSKSGDRRWLEIGASVGEKFRAFFFTRLILGTITAALYVGWLAVFGVDYLLLWGVLAVLLNFLPTIGSIIAGTLPVLYVLVTRDVASAAMIAAGLLVIEQIMGNFVDPKLMGRRLSVSPLVVLASLLFWSLLWGIPGAFLAVPLTVLITMVMAHFDQLKPAALVLTDCSSFEQLEEYRNRDKAG